MILQCLENSSILSNIFVFFSFLPIVSSFSPDTASFDAYGLKLAANDLFLVKCSQDHLAFILRHAPYNYSLSCTIAYNDSNQYIYAVAVQRYASIDDTIRFVFIGINKNTDIPFIGSLAYTSLKREENILLSCTGWQTDNYQIHELEQFARSGSKNDMNNDFFVVAVAWVFEYWPVFLMYIKLIF